MIQLAGFTFSPILLKMPVASRSALSSFYNLSNSASSTASFARGNIRFGFKTNGGGLGACFSQQISSLQTHDRLLIQVLFMFSQFWQVPVTFLKLQLQFLPWQLQFFPWLQTLAS